MRPRNSSARTIRKRRLALGLTQTQAAALIGGGLRTWQDWEYGRRNMPPAKLELFLIKAREQAQ